MASQPPGNSLKNQLDGARAKRTGDVERDGPCCNSQTNSSSPLTTDRLMIRLTGSNFSGANPARTLLQACGRNKSLRSAPRIALTLAEKLLLRLCSTVGSGTML